MTEAFWWYLLAGFFIGFSISTLWEWLYFRRRRMAIRDRRVAELEAALRTYMAAASAPSNAPAAEDWGEPQFESPHVYLETEDPSPRADEQPATPPANRARTAHAPVFVVASATTNAPTDRETDQPSTVPESPASVSFRSVAVPPAAASAVPQAAASAVPQTAASTVPQAAASTVPQAELPSSQQVQPAQATAVAGATAAAHHVVANTHAVEEQVAASAEKESFHYGRPAGATYANGQDGQRHAGTAAPVALAAVAATAEERSITSSDLDALAASINELVATLNKAPVADTQPDAAARTFQAATPPQAEIAKPMGRIERMLVRFVQALAHFARQVRAIVSGHDAPAPALSAPTPTADDLTRINGLTPAHVDRLRVAGVTTFERLAALSPEELRLITLTPGGAVVDVEQWRAQAASLAAASAERVRS